MSPFRRSFVVAAALGALAGSAERAWSMPVSDEFSFSPAHAAVDPRPRVPAAWLQGDPADSLYRLGREALNRGDWKRAADIFDQIGKRYGSSGYAGDAQYYRAFALYRMSGIENLRRALSALDTQKAKYAKAATVADAPALKGRIEAKLAELGDPTYAAQVWSDADKVAKAPEAPEAPETPETPEMAAAPKAPKAPKAAKAYRQNDQCRDGDDDDDVRVAALNGLLQMDSERALPILKKVLARRDEASACLRRKAVFLVAQKRGPETETILLDAIRNDPDGEVREQGVFWLSQVPSTRSTAILDSVLQSSQDYDVRDKALFALGQQKSPEALKALRTFAMKTSAPGELRERAIFWLGQRSDVAMPLLVEIYRQLDSQDLKEKVLFSASQNRSPESGQFLLDVAKNAKEPIELRKRAIFWLSQGRGSVAELTSLYTSMTDRELREQLIFAYSQKKDPAALDKLIEIGKKDPDKELRKKALFWLGQSRDPRAAQALAEILDQ